MGTKAKLSTKVLSFLLSALMAVSCFGIALPSLAPEAKAEEVNFQPLKDALAAAVNHSGDSDSTGAIAGNIVGAQVGLSGIPAKYTENLELRDLITEVADDLWHDCRTGGDGSVPDPVWKQKYMDICYGRD